MALIRHFHQNRDGAALLEFAIVLPVLLALCFGCFEVGRVLLTYAAVDNALRGGTRFLAQVSDASCQPACSWGALRAMELVREQIITNAGVREAAVRVDLAADVPAGTVAIAAEVDVDLVFSRWLRRSEVWTVKLSRQEQKIAG